MHSTSHKAAQGREAGPKQHYRAWFTGGLTGFVVVVLLILCVSLIFVPAITLILILIFVPKFEGSPQNEMGI